IAFREDESRARKGDSAENFNILRQIAMNVLKLDTSFKESIPNKQFRCFLDSAYLDHLVDLWICS
ncbi:MAG: ISAs1 family transposase, partial [Ruminococcus callidus]|nr:ISAs1 family transposase [Ruminococcus callidus]